MYEKLVKELRDADEISMCGECGYKGDKKGPLFVKAAEAIEELSQTAEHYKGCSDDWYREACDYKEICEQMKATVIVEAQHTEMYDERDKKTLVEMAKSLPLQIIPHNGENPRWIPVTERLPEKFQPVWVACKMEGRENWTFDTIYDPYLKCPWGTYYYLEKGEAVVYAWMDRNNPEPPKEET